MTKEQILVALRAWIKQRPGLEFCNYGAIAPYRAELRQITKDKRDAEVLLTAVALRDSITAEDLIAAFPRAYSGRLSIKERTHPHTGAVLGAVLDYCTGQYWPTEYRKAACAVLASVLWDRKREDCNANVDQREHRSLGDEIRNSFKREFGRSIQERWFS